MTIHLIMFMIYLGGFFLGTGVGARMFYTIERRRHTYRSAIAAYQDSVLAGVAIGCFWPIALPIACLVATGWMAARVFAPSEVKAEVSQHNVAMLEHVLGMRGITE